MRVALYIASAVLVLWASVTVPMPLIENSPGGTYSVPEILEIEDTSTTPIEGELRLLTVYFRQPSLAETIRARLSDDRYLEPRESYLPPDVDIGEYLEVQRDAFRREFDLAAAMGARAAGIDVQVRTGPMVVAANPDTPAEGRFDYGDIITAVDGQLVQDVGELRDALPDEAGVEVALTVLRDGEEVEVVIAPANLPGVDRPAIGVTLASGAVPYRVVHPVTVELTDQRGIGGPSAGLMIALTVYDLLSEEDLVAGRFIAGTGTIDVQGRVGAIGGLPQKIIGAVRDGAQIILVPAAQLDIALAVDVPDDVSIIAVATLDEAIAALRSPSSASPAATAQG